MIHVLVKRSPESKKTWMAQLVLERLEGALMTMCGKAPPVKPVLWKPDILDDSKGYQNPCPLPSGISASASLVLVPETRAAPGCDRDPVVGMTALIPEPFSRLGLCFWRAQNQSALMPEAHVAELASFGTLQALACTLLGIEAFLRDANKDAVRWYRRAAAQVKEARQDPSSHLLWWLGLAHLGIGQNLGFARHFNAAIAYLREALAKSGFNSEHVGFASMRGALARAHFQRPSENPFESCLVALSILDSAVTHLNSSEYPIEWAGLLCDRAVLYLYMPKGKDLTALEKAHLDLQKALTVFDKARFPAQYAQCQNILGRLNADWHRDNRIARQREAQVAFTKALEIRTKERYPWEYAQTQHNLGNLFAQIVEGDKCDNLIRAIDHLQEALSVFDQLRFPYRYVQTRAALGRAYLRLSIRGKASVRQAIECFNEIALSISPRGAPYLYAQNLSDLGDAFAEHSAFSGFDPDKAIQCYQRALQLFSKECFPVDRARVLIALAGVLLSGSGAKLEEAFAPALCCYKEALESFTHEAFPYEYSCVQASMGALEIARGDILNGDYYEEAMSRGIEHYKEAMSTFHQGGYQEEHALVRGYVEDALLKLKSRKSAQARALRT